MYPQPTAAFEEEEDDKTSVIMSPGLQDMMNNLPGRPRDNEPPATEEEESMTEVMDSSDISAFVDANADRFGAAAPMAEDHTVEMTSPLNLTRDILNAQAAAQNQPNDAHTTELTSEALRKGLQAAAAARTQAAATKTPALPPMPRPLSSRLPAISQSSPAANRAPQSTPHASPHSLQKLGQQAPAQAGNAQNTAVLQYPPQNTFTPPAPNRSFGEEPLPSPVSVPSQQFGQNQHPAPAPHTGLGDSDDTGVNMVAPVIISDGPNPNHVGPWQLRTNFGLTYEFPDTKGLQSWLSNRDELDGITLSSDGNHFYELDRFPQINKPGRATNQLPALNAAIAPNPQNAALNTSPPLAGFSGPQRLTSTPFSTADGQKIELDTGFTSAPFNATPPDPSTRITPETYKSQSASSSSATLMWVALAILLLVAGALALQTFGVITLFGSTPQPDPNPVAEVVPQPPQDVPDPEAELRAQQAELARQARNRDQLQRILIAATEDVDSNRLQVASEKLITARTLDPENIQILEMLVDVHTRLGQTSLARQASEALEIIQEKPKTPADD